MIRINNLWIILFIFVFLNGCKRKDEFSADMQLNNENSVIRDISEPEEKPHENIVHNEPIEEIKVGLKLKYASSTSDRIVYVDQNITILEFIKTSIIGLEGLGQLEFLDTIIFNLSANVNDFSFLAEVPKLKRLFINYIRGSIDFSFIEYLPDLEVLYVESYLMFDGENYYSPKIEIDLKDNRHLEYIGFRYGSLKTFPIIYNVPNSLKYLDLEGNTITSLPIDFDTYNNITIFSWNNLFAKNTMLPNVTTEPSSGVLEQKYRQPYNSPNITMFTTSISDLRD